MSPTILDPDLLSALLEAQFAHAPVTLYLDSNPTQYQSVLLGFDYYENTLLIDGLKPPVDRHLRAKLETTPFWLQIKRPHGYINILCAMESVQHDLITLKLFEGELTQNRRWSSRINFNSRKGPTLRFTLPHETPIEGHLRNLSVGGACVEFFGKDVRNLLPAGIRCNCSLQFNEQFRIALHGDIKQSRFLRTPSCHTSVRLIFNQSQPLVKAQLEEFIESFAETIAA